MASGCSAPAAQESTATAVTSAETPTPSPAELSPMDGKKSLDDLDLRDVQVDPSFTLGDVPASAVVSDTVILLKLFHTDFPEFQISSFPSAAHDVLFDRDIAPKLQPLVFSGMFPQLRDRFINKYGFPFSNALIGDSEAGTPRTYAVPGGGTCTASDKPMDHRFSGTTLSSEVDQATGVTGAIVSTSVTFTIPCAEGKQLSYMRDWRLKLAADSTKWKLYSYTVSKGRDVGFL